jgi:hypothetical protein
MTSRLDKVELRSLGFGDLEDCGLGSNAMGRSSMLLVLAGSAASFLVGCSRQEPATPANPAKGSAKQHRQDAAPQQQLARKSARDKKTPFPSFPDISKEEYWSFRDAPEPPDEMLASNLLSKAGSFVLIYGKSLAAERDRVGRAVWARQAAQRVKELRRTRPDKACIHVEVAMVALPAETQVDVALQAVTEWYAFLEKKRPAHADQAQFALFTGGLLATARDSAFELALSKSFAALRSQVTAEQKAGRAMLFGALRGRGDITKVCRLLARELHERGGISAPALKPLFMRKRALTGFMEAIATSPPAAQPQLLRWLSETGVLPGDVASRRHLLAGFLKSENDSIRQASEQVVSDSSAKKE